MKKILFTLIAIAFLAPTFAQSDLTINICGNNDEFVPQAKIVECQELFVNNDNWKVKSFTVSMSSSDGTVIELKAEGHAIPSKMIELIKENKPSKIYIENIQLISKDKKTSTAEPLILKIKN